MENIRNQSIRDGQQETFNAIFYEEVKCRTAVERYERENPQGRFRKKLIDWGQWKKAFGVRIAKIDREVDTLMDETDYIAWAMNFRLMAKEDARVKWKICWQTLTILVKALARTENFTLLP